MLTPRQYQVEAAYSILNYFTEQQGNPICVMPTGTGKSIVIAMLLQIIYSRWPTQRVMMLTHVKELIAQNYEKLLHLWPGAPCGIYSAGLNRKEAHMPILFAGIGSVAKKAPLFGHIDLIIVDEADLVSPDQETMYRTFLSALCTVNPNLKVVGFTATPWRIGQGHLTDEGVFTDICFNISTLVAFNRLIAEGYLAPLIPKHTRTMLDIDGVHSRGGEFIASELQAAVDKMEVTQAALLEAIECAQDRYSWLVFASGIEHANHITDMLNDLGIPAVAIHSKLTTAERDAAIAGFKSGKYRAAVNNNVLTTGFDHPAIDCIVMLRPTSSTRLWVQMLGRGTRPFPGKQNCLVLDFAGNTRRLGPINDPVLPRKKGDGPPGEVPVKICGVCGVYNHASVRTCCACGAEFSFQVKIKEHASHEELLKGEAPVTELYRVDHVTYAVHHKPLRPPILKVTYYCGLRHFIDYVCIEHAGFAGRKARAWWNQRTGSPFPSSTDEACDRASQELKVATDIRVWVNKPFPEILAYCFDGTCFGSAPVEAGTTLTAADLDDDIPF